jgi:hypothetical protein
MLSSEDLRTFVAVIESRGLPLACGGPGEAQ